MRSECRVGGGPALVESQMIDEVTVQYRKVSSQARSECKEGGGPALAGLQMTDDVTVQKREVSSQVTRGHRAEETEVQLQLDHIGQTRPQYRRGMCPACTVTSPIFSVIQLELDLCSPVGSENRRGHSTEEEDVQPGHTRSDEVML